MKLLTHNMLACHIRSHKHEEPQPFVIEAEEVSQLDADFDPDFLRRMYSRIIWSTLHTAAIAMGKSFQGHRPRACLQNLQPSIVDCRREASSGVSTANQKHCYSAILSCTLCTSSTPSCDAGAMQQQCNGMQKGSEACLFAAAKSAEWNSER